MKAMGVLARDGARFGRRCSGVLQLCTGFFIIISVILGIVCDVETNFDDSKMFFIFVLTRNEGHRFNEFGLDLDFGE